MTWRDQTEEAEVWLHTSDCGGPVLPRHNVLALVAHPDDESVGLGFYLQESSRTSLVFLTSGEASASIASYIANGGYSYLREREVTTALSQISNIEFLRFARIPDKQLYNNLQDAVRIVAETVRVRQSTALITHAFEGGHPDHDCCSFIANRVAMKADLPVWEFPEYSGPPRNLVQCFADADPSEVAFIRPRPGQVAMKQQLFRCYRSQKNVLSMFDPQRPELFRRQPSQNYYAPTWSTYFSNPGYSSDVVGAQFVRYDQQVVTDTKIAS